MNSRRGNKISKYIIIYKYKKVILLFDSFKESQNNLTIVNAANSPKRGSIKETKGSLIGQSNMNKRPSIYSDMPVKEQLKVEDVLPNGISVVQNHLISDVFYPNEVKKYDSSSKNFYHENSQIAYDSSKKQAFFESGELAYDIGKRQLFYVNTMLAFDFESKIAYYSNGDVFPGDGTVADNSFNMHLTGKYGTFNMQLGRNFNARVIMVNGERVYFNLILDGKCVVADL